MAATAMEFASAAPRNPASELCCRLLAVCARFANEALKPHAAKEGIATWSSLGNVSHEQRKFAILSLPDQHEWPRLGDQSSRVYAKVPPRLGPAHGNGNGFHTTWRIKHDTGTSTANRQPRAIHKNLWAASSIHGGRPVSSEKADRTLGSTCCLRRGAENNCVLAVG